MAAPATVDQQLLSDIQQKFGSTDFGQFQAIRYTWYSKQTYAQAGSNEFSFFGDVVGQAGVNLGQTNMTRANSFSQRAFLMRSMRCHFFLSSSQIASTAVNTTYLGVLHDVCNSASSLEFKIQDKEYLRLGQPLLYAPFASGLVHNTIAVAQPSTSALNILAYGNASTRKDDAFVFEPPQLIESETVFTVKIQYPTAVALPSNVTGTIGVWIDGVIFRPLQ